MIKGIVIHGDGIGRTFGFPTANIEYEKKHIKFDSGVYAVYVLLDTKKYIGALAIRKNPILKLEVHLIDYRGYEFYGAYIEVDVIQKVSEMERYDNKKELIDKIERDIVCVQKLLDINNCDIL